MLNFPAKYFLLIALIFFAAGLEAQTTLTGKIIDAHTKEPVPYASVYLKKSGIGQTSDSAGNFIIHINNLQHDSLVISYVGYESFMIPVTEANDNRALDIQLQRGGLTGNVIIKAKFNKGLFLWRKIMSKKKQ